MVTPAAASADITGDITVAEQEQLLGLVQQHLIAEVVTGNLDAVMATVASDPVWTFQPLGYMVTGTTAVREAYRRLIANFLPLLLPGANHGQWFSQSAMVTEDDVVLALPRGGSITSPVVSGLVFEGSLLQSERVYLGRELAPFVAAALGPGFTRLPGVTVSP
jgi:hypothetical protein